MSRGSHFWLRLASSTLLLGLVATSSLSAQTTLRWKFHAGERLSQVIEQKMVMSASAGDLDIETKMNQTIDATLHVTAVDAQGTATIEQTFSRIRMKMDALGNGFEFDSDNPQELAGIGALVAPALKALAGAQFTLTFSPTGQIEKVEVPASAVDALKSLPGVENMGGMFSKEGLIKMIQQGSQSFPVEAITPGHSWTNEAVNELSQVGKMKIVSTLTYVGPEVVAGKKLERIGVDVTTTLPNGGNGLVALKDQSAKGSIFFDNEAGRMSHSMLTQNMVMKITFAGQAIDQKIKQTINVRMAEVAN